MTRRSLRHDPPVGESDSTSRPVNRAAAERPRRAARRRRWPWVLGALLIIAGALVWFAPAIVAGTSLRQRIIPLALPKFAGQSAVGFASLNWLAPVELRDVVLRDAAGQPLAELASVRIETPLWQLVRSPQQPGRVTLTGVTVHASLRENGSNLEDALLPLLASDPHSPPVVVQLAISGGTILMHDAVTGRQSRISEVAGEIATPADAQQPLRAKLQAKLDDPAGSGTLQAEFTSDAGGADASKVHIVTSQVPLGPLLARRFVGTLALAGIASGDVTLQYGAGGQAPSAQPRVEVDGQCQVVGFQLAAQQWMGSDVLRSSQLQYAGRMRFDSRQIAASGVRLITDLGSVEIHGAAPWASLRGVSVGQAGTLLQKEEFLARGQIDLAKLAAAMPATLRIRQGTQVTAGSVQFLLQSRKQPQGHAWQAQIETSNITAQAGQRRVQWPQPIVLKLAARETPAGVAVEQLVCQANFMQIDGRGTLDDATLVARADLAKLAAQLGQIVDLDRITLAGQLQAGLRVQRGENDRLTVHGAGQVDGLHVAAPGMLPWQEQQLNLAFDAAANASRDFKQSLVEQAALTLASGEDRAAITLTQAVANPTLQTVWPLKIEAQGKLPSWAARLQSVLPVAGWQLAGDVNLTASAAASPAAVEIATSQCDLSNLEAQGHGQVVREQLARISATGRYDLAQRKLFAKLLTVATTSWSLRGDDVNITLAGEAAPSLAGQFSFRSDLRRTLDSLRPPRAAAGVRMRGQLTGDAQVSVAAGVTTANLTAQIDNFVIERASVASADPAVAGVRPISAATAPSVTPLWAERQLKFSGAMRYAPQQDALQLAGMKMEISGAAMTCQGTIAAITSAPFAELEAEANYNLAVLAQRLRPLLGQDLQLAGADAAKFTLRGPLMPPALEVGATQVNAAAPSGSNLPPAMRDRAGPGNEAAAAPAPPAAAPWVSSDLVGTGGFKWESATIYGLGVGQGALAAELRRGVVDVQPLTLAVSDGKLHLAPRLYLNESPAIFTLDRGPLADKVQLTPQICRAWLKYVAPLLADATDCRGQLSATLDRATFPLATPQAGTLDAMLTVHSADIRPGPLAMQYIGLAQQIESLFQGQPREGTAAAPVFTLVHLDEQQLRIQMTQGRVHHQGLKMKVGDVVIITSGSVGTDQTLDLVAEVPIQEGWTSKHKLLRNLQGQSVRVPIKGTIGRPLIDRTALDELGRQIVGGAASNLINREVNRLLEGLIKPGAGGQESGVRGQESGVRGQGTGVSGQGTGVGGQPSGASGQGSGVSGQQSGAPNQGAAIPNPPAPIP